MTDKRRTAVVVRSPPNTDEASRALKLARALPETGGKAVLCLIGDAVLMADELCREDWEVFCLRQSLEMRGLSPDQLRSRAVIGSYGDLIDLLLSEEMQVVGSL